MKLKNINFDFNEDVFWQLMGCMERNEPLTQEDTDYLLYKILSGIISSAKDSFTEEEKHQYNIWKMNEEELTEFLLDRILQNFKEYAKNHNVDEHETKNTIAWEDYFEWEKQIENIVCEKYSNLSIDIKDTLFHFLKNDIPQRFWYLSPAYLKRYPNIDYGTTLNETKFPEATGYGDILINVQNIESAMAELNDRIKNPERYRMEENYQFFYQQTQQQNFYKKIV